MNIRLTFIFAGMALMLSTAACDSGSSDEPEINQSVIAADSTTVSDPADSSTVSDPEDEFVPWTGEIEPLSDELRPVLTIGKKWISEVTFDATEYSAYKKDIWTLCVVGDTILNGVSAKKLKDPTHTDYAFEKEENGKVCMGETEDSQNWTFNFNHVLYDILADSHDVIKNSYVPITVLSRGTIVLMGKTRRCVKVKVGKPMNSAAVNDYDYWVEGIGPLFNEHPDYSTVSTTVFRPSIKRLLKCYDGDQLIYDYREFNDALYQPTEIFYEE